MRLGLSIALIVSLLTPAIAAQDSIHWKNVGAWTIKVDTSLGNSCFAAILYEDYTVFRIGFQEPGAAAAMYVGLGNLNWKSLETGKDYKLFLQLDNEKPWSSPARAAMIGQMPFLFIQTNQIRFVDQLMRKHALRVYFDGRQILNLSLRGSFAAIEELAVCQKTVDEVTKTPEGPSDPFSGVSQPDANKDPFRL